jgi:hypothetical protein
MMDKSQKWYLSIVVLAVLGLALAITACGGGGSSSSTAGTTAKAESAEPVSEDQSGETGSVPAPPEQPQTKIGVTTPLTEKPPSGKTIGWAVCELPT